MDHEKKAMLVLSGSDVRELLSYAECATVMRSALADLARGEIEQPLRSVVRPAGAAGFQVLMPSYSASAGYGLKALCITPGNPARGLDAHQGAVLLYTPDTGEPAALINASALTEIRTAAVSAVATELLALPGASVAAIIGIGVQGVAHARALAAVRALTGIRMYGRSASRAASVAVSLTGELGVPVTAAVSAEEAVDGAGIVVTATSSATPVIAREWLAPGVHINAVGSCVPSAREIDAATMAAAALFADSRESLENEAGDYLLAIKDGALAGPARATLGDLLTGTGEGRRDEGEITLFESLGLAAEDLMAASFVYQKAIRLGAGTTADF
jgi:ornithine cyclodeaminase/alanine dehydrogenase-like protein (mu-crystallin family)